MGQLGNIKIETDLIVLSKIRCINTKCIFNLVTYPGSWASCNLKYIDIDTNGMCESKQEKKDGQSSE